MKHIQKCPFCEQYTLQSRCPQCQTTTISSKPPKFSPVDKYGSYRRKEKTLELKKKGLY